MLNVWPCDLFIVIAKAKTIGNCFLLTINGNQDDSAALNVILGIKTLFPDFSPVIISASMLYLNSLIIFNRVPLHKPSFMLKFLFNVTIAFIFRFNSFGGKPSRILCNYSIGKLMSILSSDRSTPLYVALSIL